MNLNTLELTGIKYERQTYFKTRAIDFEVWFNNLSNALEWFNFDEINILNDNVLELANLKYSICCVIVNNKKELSIEQNQNG